MGSQGWETEYQNRETRMKSGYLKYTRGEISFGLGVLEAGVRGKTDRLVDAAAQGLSEGRYWRSV